MDKKTRHNLIYGGYSHENYADDYLVKTQEYSALADIIHKGEPFRMLVRGVAGAGKTTLLKHFAYTTPNSHYIQAMDLAKLEPHEIQGLKQYDILFIDALDEIYHEQEERIYKTILPRIENKRVVFSTRPTDLIRYSLHGAFITNEIEFAPMSNMQMEELLKKRFDFLSTEHRALFEIFNARTPLIINKLGELLNNYDLGTWHLYFASFLHDIGHVPFSHLHMRNQEIILPPKDIEIPSKEIITNITSVNDSLFRKVRQDPELLHRLSWIEFERFCCEFFENLGYEVSQTKLSKDGGKDLIIYKKRPIGNHRDVFFVECKKYDKTRPISVGLVRGLYGAVESNKVTGGFMATTSYYSSDAKKFAADNKHRLDLIDYLDLLAELTKK